MSEVWNKVLASRDVSRLKPLDYVTALFEEVIELKGDRYAADDPSIRGGIASFRGLPVTFLAFAKAHTAEENLAGNFGMANPQGYRKCLRLIRQAEKFGRPVITFIDTPGAYPGIAAEEMGQGEAIAKLMMEFQFVKVPTIALITGEGGSGGALCLSVTDRLFMMEKAIFAILSPEGFSAILWKDKRRAQEAADLMKITASDLHEFGICEAILPESADDAETLDNTADFLWQSLTMLREENPEERLARRHEKIRRIGLL